MARKRLLAQGLIAAVFAGALVGGVAVPAQAAQSQIWDITCGNWRTGDSWYSSGNATSYASTLASGGCTGSYAAVRFSSGSTAYAGNDSTTYASTTRAAVAYGGYHKGKASGSVWSSSQ